MKSRIKASKDAKHKIERSNATGQANKSIGWMPWH